MVFDENENPMKVTSSRLLRTRLVLGLSSLLLILLVVGLYSIKTSSELGRSIELIVADNYASIDSVQKIKLACARLNVAVVMKLTRDDEESMLMYRQNKAILNESISIQAQHTSNPKEEALTQKLQTQINKYIADSERFFALSTKNGMIPQHYVSELSPEIIAIDETADQILMLQQQNLEAKKLESKLKVSRANRALFFAMIMAVIVSLYASYRIGRSILQPIEVLTRSVRQIEKGDLDQIVPMVSTNELGELATSFNQMTSQLRRYRESTSEKIIRLHRTMETTLAAFPHPIFILGAEGNIELRNPAAEEFDSKSGNEGQFQLPEKIHAHVKETLTTEIDYLPGKLKDAVNVSIKKEEKFFLPRVLLLREENKSIFGVAVVLEDVTNLRLVDDLKTDLISTVSHELKTPLTGVRMALHLLLEKDVGPLTDRQAQLLEVAKEDSERLLYTLNNLLDLARWEAAGPRLNLNIVSAEELIQTAIKETRNFAKHNHIKVSLQIQSPIKKLKVDERRISHVFTNLINNAIKHSPEGGEVLVSAKELQDGIIRISVSDHGPGIDPKHQQLIFEKFYRVPGQTKNGAGLGLSIAREVAFAHGGNIWVTSNEGKGSEFCVDLPAADMNLSFST
jgi:two-component system, NtrC family, sensor histidine kinase KinB